MGLIGAAIGAAGSIFGGIAASKAMKKVKNNLEQQKRANQAWYDQRYNEDATQRADAQRILQMTQDSIRKRNLAAAGTQAVMGGTDESTAIDKAANNQALSSAASQIAAQGDARKDQIERTYQAQDANLTNQINETERQRANAISGAVQGLAGAAADMDFGSIKIGKNRLDL